MVAEPRRVVTIFWAGGLIFTASILSTVQWSALSFLALLVVAGVCAASFVVRVAWGTRLPSWTLHVDLVVGTTIVTVGVIVGASIGVGLAGFYIWQVLFAALYFRPLVVICYFASSLMAYAMVLLFGPRVDGALTEWFALFVVTLAVAGVVYGITGLLRRAGLEDVLTGLANRRYLDERLDEELERSRRTGKPMSLLMIDLNGFKVINDCKGHDAGDRLLRDLARAWKPVMRSGGDFLARVGGDEFVILAPDSDDLGVQRLVERLVEALPNEVGCSVGAATWDGYENNLDLMRRADQKMYEMKIRHRSHEVARGA